MVITFALYAKDRWIEPGREYFFACLQANPTGSHEVGANFLYCVSGPRFKTGGEPAGLRARTETSAIDNMMQMLAAYVAARRVRRARAIKKAQLMMRLVTYQFSALVLKSFAMRRHRIETKVRHQFTRAELPAPDKSSWKYVVSAGLDSGYLEMTALTVGSFRKLHDEFAPRMTAHWDSNRVNEGGPRVSQRGRPRLCSTWDNLGLVLCYFHQMDLQGSLGQKFGFTPTATNRYLNAGREVLLQTLRHIPDATIKWPRRHEMERHARRISRAQPHLTGCFCQDGLSEIPGPWT